MDGLERIDNLRVRFLKNSVAFSWKSCSLLVLRATESSFLLGDFLSGHPSFFGGGLLDNGS